MKNVAEERPAEPDLRLRYATRATAPLPCPLPGYGEREKKRGQRPRLQSPLAEYADREKEPWAGRPCYAAVRDG